MTVSLIRLNKGLLPLPRLEEREVSRSLIATARDPLCLSKETPLEWREKVKLEPL